MKSLWQSWEGFWGVRGNTFALGLFRILFAYSLFDELNTTRLKSTYAIADSGFHLPYVSFIVPVSERTYELIHLAQYPLFALLAIGLFSRISCGLLIALQGYVFFADQLNFRNHPYFFLLLLLLLMLSPAHESISWKSIVRMYRQGRASMDALIGPVRQLTYQRMLQVMLCAGYFFAGLHKINRGFLGGDVLGKQMAKTAGEWGDKLQSFPFMLSEGAVSWIQDVLQAPASLIAAAIVSVVLELGLPLTLWFRRTRAVSMVLGIGFHLGIWFLMNISVFSLTMMSLYLLFLENDTLPNLARRLVTFGGSLARRVSGRPRHPADSNV